MKSPEFLRRRILGWAAAAVLCASLPVGLGCSRPGSPDESQAAFCEEHGVPEAWCPFCDPSLIEQMGTCGEHGVPEALCTRCAPDLIAAFKAEGDWCEGHSLPESQCALCNPEILGAPTVGEDEGGEIPGEGSVSTEMIPADDLPRAARPPSVRCDTERLRIRLDSPEVARNAGLEFARVTERPLPRTVEAHASIAYDENRLARVGARVPGTVREVKVDLGDPIEAGQALAVIDSVDLGAAKADHLQAVALRSLWKRNHDREQKLLEKGISTESDALEAETRFEESRIAVEQAIQRLRNLGLDEEVIETGARSGDTTSHLSLRSPREGVVVERSAVVGQVVDPTETLFVVADPGRLWATIDVYQDDATRIRVGQDVVLRVDGLRGAAFGGRITWVGTAVDPRTRTIPVRAVVESPEGLLRANLFGRAEIRVREALDAVVVPREAVQWEGCCNIVFLKRSETLYEPRKVRLGYRTDRVFEVLDGLAAGDVVVTRGSFLLKTEILRESIGAGCCGVE